MVKKRRFWIGMAVYAVVFLEASAIGLRIFWKYLESYERSRPITAIQRYMGQLTVIDMCNGSEELLAQIDANIQSREQCFQVIQNALTEEVTFSKNNAESTDSRQTYVLRSGAQTVGAFVLTPAEVDEYHFRHWEVTEERFDFSYLMGDPVTIIVPEDFQVSINGTVLDRSYIVQSEIPYKALEDFYGTFPMPTMVRYYIDDYLGQPALEVVDRDGNIVMITDETDLDAFLPQCTELEKAQLDSFLAAFLARYVAFTGSSNRAAGQDYLQLAAYLVPQSELAQRLYTAIDGLSYAQSRGDEIDDIIVHRYVPLEDGRFFCDLTYYVTTLGRKGAVQTASSVKLVILETDKGLRVEAMDMY